MLQALEASMDLKNKKVFVCFKGWEYSSVGVLALGLIPVPQKQIILPLEMTRVLTRDSFLGTKTRPSCPEALLLSLAGKLRSARGGWPGRQAASISVAVSLEMPWVCRGLRSSFQLPKQVLIQALGRCMRTGTMGFWRQSPLAEGLALLKKVADYVGLPNPV